MDSQYERLYDPGQVHPLPQRDPMRALADWGAPPEPPVPPYALDDERAYVSPGPPPWVQPRRQTPAWALAAVLVGSALILVTAAVLFARYAG